MFCRDDLDCIHGPILQIRVADLLGKDIQIVEVIDVTLRRAGWNITTIHPVQKDRYRAGFIVWQVHDTFITLLELGVESLVEEVDCFAQETFVNGELLALGTHEKCDDIVS